MSMKIHETAIVSPEAKLADDVEIGPFAIIENNVIIGRGCKIGPRVTLAWGTRLGEKVAVHTGAVLGTVPQDLKFHGEETILQVGDNTIVREYATLNRGTTDKRKTVVGSNCLLMAYTHVAHDCLLGDHVIMGNATTLAGHIEIGDFAIISGLVPVHQFVKIGAHTMIGGGFRVPMDIIPYALCAGYPLRVMGPNLVGLRRRDFSPEVIKTLQETFRLLFRSGLNTTQAVERIKADIEPIAEVREILEFIENSDRGICK